MGAQNEFILELLEMALKNNYFQFASHYYRQLRSTSMGAPAYGCLHLGWWEEDTVYTLSMYQSHAHLWLWYIDDVLMVWTGTRQELVDFMDILGHITRNICLTYVADPC